MAEDKKSFILYADQISTFEDLPDEIAGKLIKIIYQYVNDKNPEVDDLLLKIAWGPIKTQLKRDLKNWSESRSKRSEAGKKGGINSGIARSSEAKRSNASNNEANEAVNVNVNGNVNGNVTEESNTHPLKNSNLFRQPKIPTYEDVHRAFFSNGGTEEMAKVFYERNNSTGWFLKGSPITNFINLIPSFITNWIKNEKNGKSTSAKTSAEKFAARVEHANRYSEDGHAGPIS